MAVRSEEVADVTFKTWIKALNLRDELVQQYQNDPALFLQKLPEAQFRTALLVTAETMKLMRDEAIRRGIWDDIRHAKVGQP